VFFPSHPRLLTFQALLQSNKAYEQLRKSIAVNWYNLEVVKEKENE
jgi:hypothetical protein